MTDSLDEKHERNREQRLAFVRRWADDVRTHSDAEWSGSDGDDGADSIDHARRKNRNGNGDGDERSSDD
jgi:hypothetical protein